MNVVNTRVKPEVSESGNPNEFLGVPRFAPHPFFNRRLPAPKRTKRLLEK